MSQRQKHASTSTNYIDLTEDQAVITHTANDKKSETCRCSEEVQRLRVRLQEIGAERDRLALELLDTKAQLKDTQAFLGQTVMAARTKGPSIATSGSSRSVASAEPVNTPQKRSRSPSITSVDNGSAPSSKKPKKEVMPNLPKVQHSTKVKAKSSPRPPGPTIEETSEVENAGASRSLERLKDSPKKDSLASKIDYAGKTGATPMKVDSRSLNVKQPASSERAVRRIELAQLNDVTKLEISPAPSTLSVPRAFLCAAYGGPFMSLTQELNFKKPADKTGSIRIAIYPKPDMNPKTPNIPGASGFLYASREDVITSAPFSLFYKACKAPVQWKYLGEYKTEVYGKMSGNSFASQPATFKNTWAGHILNKQNYARIRARIALRRAGHQVSDEEELNTTIDEDSQSENALEEPVKKAAKDNVGDEVSAIINGKGLPVTEQDIIDALSRGDEGIKIVRMTCILYDHDFAHDIERRFVAWKEGGEMKEAPKENTNGKKKTRKAATKRASKNVTILKGSSCAGSSSSTGEPRRSSRPRRAPRRMETSDEASDDSTRESERDWP
ncbi:hypothetical protein NLJ89_g9860 [Agrocybe chaxingu]|uniref:DUF6697 domain-containing protein n=1 Tax=Agrocybe chaxingu TaxID=84603 RepID=A0A9W8JPY4_9AGAR|nr:hypothetical protein NLJ89_g9860 [Agrocybe chaxingu]